jgi:hypothetical protein
VCRVRRMRRGVGIAGLRWGRRGLRIVGHDGNLLVRKIS